ncbi:MAG: hypothetical protein K0S00_3862 [Xanthobacteraceae bacterium]|jgi:hypothetical protein|nr:hypothetical protein [Xanthobacteraceae bacterium]
MRRVARLVNRRRIQKGYQPLEAELSISHHGTVATRADCTFARCPDRAADTPLGPDAPDRENTPTSMPRTAHVYAYPTP